MIHKTWPYGTTRRARVIEKDLCPPGCPKEATADILLDDQGEGHLCAGDNTRDPSSKVNDWGTLTFTKGGPTGGYWKFTKDHT